MTELLNPSDFSALTDPLKVDVKIGDRISTIELAVLAVEARPPHRHREAPFSLTLVGPRQPLLPQGTYPLRHPALGVVRLFLVPSGQDATSSRYEVTFN